MRMKISASEQLAIMSVLDAGRDHGYGNMISHLRTGWARELVAKYGFSEEEAMQATHGSSPMPLLMQEDLIERGEFEVGKF